MGRFTRHVGDHTRVEPFLWSQGKPPFYQVEFDCVAIDHRIDADDHFFLYNDRTRSGHRLDYLWLSGAKSLFYSIWGVLRYGITFALLLLTFYLVYRYLPNRKLNGGHVLAGTVFATFGWVGASLLFSFYVNNFGSYATIYGSLGGLFALIIWIYISTLIFLLGGALNAICSDTEGGKKQ